MHVCGENRNKYNNLVGNPDGKKLMGNRKMEGENNAKTGIKVTKVY